MSYQLTRRTVLGIYAVQTAIRLGRRPRAELSLRLNTDAVRVRSTAEAGSDPVETANWGA